MFSIGSHIARCFFITKVVSLPPVKLGVLLLTQKELIMFSTNHFLWLGLCAVLIGGLLFAAKKIKLLIQNRNIYRSRYQPCERALQDIY